MVVAICYRIAGHVKYAAKEGFRVFMPRYLFPVSRFFIARQARMNERARQARTGNEDEDLE